LNIRFTQQRFLLSWIILPAVLLGLLVPLPIVQAAGSYVGLFLPPRDSAPIQATDLGSSPASGHPATVSTPSHPFVQVENISPGLHGYASGRKAVDGQLESQALVTALQKGGYVVYFRHASTERTQTDTDTIRLNNCSTQRNLSDQGRVEAREAGNAFRVLQIPVGQVYASAYCRTRHTAHLAFGWAEIREDLTGVPADKLEDRQAALAKMLSTTPRPGKNTILVGHGENIAVTAGIVIGEGEAAIFSPLEDGRFSLVGRIRPVEWKKLVSTLSLPGGAVDSMVDYRVEKAPPFLANDPDLLMPDLQTLPPTDVVYQAIQPNQVELIRLTNTISNAGIGPLEIQGIHQDEKTTVIQRISKADGSVVEQVAGEFVFHPTHDHWHFENFARYEIWSLTPAGELEALVASSGKVSFCLRDNFPINLPNKAPRPVYTICTHGTQGISVGWTDVYEYDLPDQTIDITNVPVGVYALRSVTDPNNQLWELDDTNNAATIYIEILPGAVQIVRDPEVLEQLFGKGFPGVDT